MTQAHAMQTALRHGWIISFRFGDGRVELIRHNSADYAIVVLRGGQTMSRRTFRRSRR